MRAYRYMIASLTALALVLGYAALDRESPASFAGRVDDVAIAACEAEARSYGIDPDAADIVAGTDDPDVFDLPAEDATRILCGFGGDDRARVGETDIFLGGDGDDVVNDVHGAFHGGPGNDMVPGAVYGTFAGGPGEDDVFRLDGGRVIGGDNNDHVAEITRGTFDGGAGDDSVGVLVNGSVSGGDGDDRIDTMNGGRVHGGTGNDSIRLLEDASGGAVFRGGPGEDWIDVHVDGQFNQD